MNAFTNTRSFANRQSQHGLSLIEMMISITIGLLILSALTTLFANQSKTRSELDESNRMIDNGRYALEVLSENLRLAGFYGTLDPSSIAVGAIPDPCSTDMVAIALAIPFHVQGYDAANTGAAIAALPTCVPATLKTGSDVLVVRRVDTSTAVAQASAVAGTTYLQASQCQYAPDTTTIYKVDSVPANFTLRQRNCTTTSTTPYAELRRMMVHIYFIDSNNQAGDGIPTLKRIELSDTGTMAAADIKPLVEGIEFMQVDYGYDDPTLDTNGDGVAGTDGIADSYTDCAACTATDWSNVVSVKLNIIARNIKTSVDTAATKVYSLGLAGTHTPAAGDRYKRHAYTQVVRLVNPSGRREVVP